MHVSCGIIGIDLHTRKVLLVRQKDDSFWSFPKGMPEAGETPEQTAIRELKEEVGLDVLTIFGSPLELEYNLPGGGEAKKTILFLAHVSAARPQGQVSEISDCQWLTLEQAFSLPLYPNIRATLEKLSPYFLSSAIPPLKKVAVLQSFFIPWPGVFNQIASVDTFVVGDNFQFSKNSWVNRNKVKTVNGDSQWLTVPIQNKDAIKKDISEIEICYKTDWLKKHLFSIHCNYKKSPYFDLIYTEIEQAFNARHGNIFALNHDLLLRVLKLLNIPTRITLRSDYKNLPADRSASLVEIVKRENANYYLTGPSAEDYLDESLFRKEGFFVEYQKFSMPTYQQMWGEFVPRLSIVDALFNIGIERTREILYAGK